MLSYLLMGERALNSGSALSGLAFEAPIEQQPSEFRVRGQCKAECPQLFSVSSSDMNGVPHRTTSLLIAHQKIEKALSVDRREHAGKLRLRRYVVGAAGDRRGEA